MAKISAIVVFLVVVCLVYFTGKKGQMVVGVKVCKFSYPPSEGSCKVKGIQVCTYCLVPTMTNVKCNNQLCACEFTVPIGTECGKDCTYSYRPKNACNVGRGITVCKHCYKKHPTTTNVTCNQARCLCHYQVHTNDKCSTW
ncbi:hypoxia-responsive family protein / zinc finger(C3HC4-type RING finger) family protein [Striga asiatica]|uniref:Hypoxia-responsive family protein / zinc finger(C3HC4-type RING finger) family protein n=1 Tax=Striga asiatica TaxID=4170 RepID=A0A5A7NY59_STRAF|nr:hypoxia-responsive family protein / zinc finger(C3HC4-type RING finger) family protein [Striga asiatica]